MPDNQLEISDLAIEQINALFDFHENVRKGTGTDFLEVLWECMDKIQQYPQHWQYLKTEADHIRRAITAHPQSIILYSFESGTVFVYEVYDSRQDWK